MNQPAFPLEFIYTQENEKFNGMTLRDYFAAKAMAVVMPAVITELQRKSHSDEQATKLRDVAAGACYGIADAMLKVRGA